MKIEKRTIEFIPENERHGKSKSLFYVWFGANTNVTAIAAGVIPISLGLNLIWSMLSIILGTMIGAIFMAAHSAQGPKLGIPQMIQSRAQFGVIGAIIPVIFVMFIYLGFFVSNTLLSAQIIEHYSPLSYNSNIYLVAFICFLIALFGYKIIHQSQKILTILSLIVFIVMSYFALQHPIPAIQWNIADFSLSKFLISVSICVTWQLSYAPYVADYSRYLPSNTSSKEVFWYSYAGTCLGGIWMMVLGSIFAVSINNFSNNIGNELVQLFGPVALIIAIFLLYGQIAINVFNLYGAFMSSITMVEPFTKFKINLVVRTLFLLIIVIIATMLCISAPANFIEFFTNFIFFMSYFLIPWTSINLVDFYFIRKGQYKIEDIFNRQGIYGSLNLKACFTFIIAILCEIPFINTTIYIGPIAKMLNGIDLAWLVGLIIPALLYIFFHRKINK